MTSKRTEKKSETLEVRLPHSKKEAFKAACEEEGITASHAVRTFIDAYLKRSARVKLKQITEDITMKLFRNPLKTAGVTSAGIAAAILFSASPSMAEDDVFTQLDKNADGFLTADETDLLEPRPAQPLPKALADAGVTAGSRVDYTKADANKDGKFSREEFATLNSVSFEFDGIVNGQTLPPTEDGKSRQITFVGPKTANGETPLELDEDRLREALKSGEVTWVSREEGEEQFIITTRTPPETDE